MHEPIKYLTIKKAFDEFEFKSQIDRNKVIDDFWGSQPNIILLFKTADKILVEIEVEIIIQLSCVIWMSFKRQKIKIRSISEISIANHLSNNVWMKKLIESDKDIIGHALEGYKNKELLKFVYSMLTGRWASQIKNENSANLMFYTLKTLIDSIESNSE